tara:strand:+ start:1158 stop:1406 length:249 start_codon:yes stop_codon:yes gene_type:complete
MKTWVVCDIDEKNINTYVFNFMVEAINKFIECITLDFEVIVTMEDIINALKEGKYYRAKNGESIAFTVTIEEKTIIGMAYKL